MKIVLKTSGGIGGLRFESELDTADLPPELAQRTEEQLSSESLRSVASLRSRPSAASVPADAQQYEIHLLPEADDSDSEVERHVIDDLCPKGEILDVIDDLLAEIRRKS